jgi:hypothetical protein
VIAGPNKKYTFTFSHPKAVIEKIKIKILIILRLYGASEYIFREYFANILENR